MAKSVTLDGFFRHLDEAAVLLEAQRAAQNLARHSGAEKFLNGEGEVEVGLTFDQIPAGSPGFGGNFWACHPE